MMSTTTAPGSSATALARRTHSERLHAHLEAVLPSAQAVNRSMRSHPRIADLVPVWARAVHGYMRASVPLLECAAEQCRTVDDELARRLLAYYEKHVEEERGHDEWVAADLAAMDHPKASLDGYLPDAAIASLVGAQYYWILHVHPVALMGYIAVLEGYPPSSAAIDGIVAASGYPREAFSTMLTHSDLDQEHRAEFFEELDNLPLDKAGFDLVALSALQTIVASNRAYSNVLALA